METPPGNFVLSSIDPILTIVFIFLWTLYIIKIVFKQFYCSWIIRSDKGVINLFFEKRIKSNKIIPIKFRKKSVNIYLSMYVSVWTWSWVSVLVSRQWSEDKVRSKACQKLIKIWNMILDYSKYKIVMFYLPRFLSSKVNWRWDSLPIHKIIINMLKIINTLAALQIMKIIKIIERSHRPASCLISTLTCTKQPTLTPFLSLTPFYILSSHIITQSYLSHHSIFLPLTPPVLPHIPFYSLTS